MTNSINLNKISLPLKISEEITELTQLYQQERLKKPIQYKAEIKKLSPTEFNFVGLIQGELDVECQYCLKPISIQINIKSNTIIQDLLELDDADNDMDIHFQNLDSFNIEDLVLEEIYLNSPTSIACPSKNCRNNKETSKETEKLRPFEKIRDLIK